MAGETVKLRCPASTRSAGTFVRCRHYLENHPPEHEGSYYALGTFEHPERKFAWHRWPVTNEEALAAEQALAKGVPELRQAEAKAQDQEAEQKRRAAEILPIPNSEFPIPEEV